MELLMDLFELQVGHVGIDLGGGEVFVTQKLLDRSKIRPITKEIRRKGMAQGMRRWTTGDPRL
jgi:hypothetical protein